MNITKQTDIMDNLEKVLQKQIELTLQGNFKAVEKLTEQAGCEIKKILSQKLTEIPDFENKRKNILKMYEKLNLMLSAEKEIVKGQQRMADNVRKTLSAYHTKG
jgi:hypothetical protein